MDVKLAKYLFADEMLYSLNKAKQTPKSIEVVDSVIVDIKKEGSTKEVTAKPKVEPSIAANSPTPKTSIKSPSKESIEKEDLVFGMETHHLLVFSRLEPDEKDFLLKILQALGLSFTKVDLLDIQKEPLVDFKQTIHENVVRTIIFFGEESGKDFLPKLNLPSYTVRNLKNINFLYSDSLKQVAKNEDNEKRQLWDALKSIFQN